MQAAVGHGQPVLAIRATWRGAATNPDPEVFAYRRGAGAPVHGRHPAPRRRQLRAVGRPRGLRDAAQHRPEARARPTSAASCSMVVEHKHKIGFKGTILIEPKPHEPTKHQYDFDTATVYGFLQKIRPGERDQGQHRGQPRDARRPQLRARDRRSPRRSASSASIDINRGDPQNGWDTDQFPNNVRETDAGAVSSSSRPAASPPAASTSTPRCAASASTRPTCSTATSAASTCCARAPADRRRDDRERRLAKLVEQRYAGWDGELGKRILAGKIDLAQLADHVLQRKLDPTPRSGQQERLENLVELVPLDGARAAGGGLCPISGLDFGWDAILLVALMIGWPGLLFGGVSAGWPGGVAAGPAPSSAPSAGWSPGRGTRFAWG